jgi:hypothetical protein
MITLATDRYSSLPQLAQILVSAMVCVERSAELRSEALAMVKSRSVQVASAGIGAEDWDLLFGAVLARLVSTCADAGAQAANGAEDAWSNGARSAILECVQALEQLRANAPRM